MKKLLCTVAALLIGVTAGAQTSQFEGFSAALNLSLIGTSTKMKFDQDPTTDLDSTTVLDGLGKNGVVGSLQAAYGFSMSKNAVLTLGASYALGAPKIWTLIDDVNGPTSGKAKNMASLYIEPGFVVADKTLVYGKLSYETAKVDIPGDDEIITISRKKIHGTGLGLGMRTMLNKNMFLQAEVKKINYRSARSEDELVDFKTSATVGNVGIGWKF